MLVQQRIDYRQALVAHFEQPQWGMTLLFVTLAMLVPMIGPVVAFGYQATVVEALAREGLPARMPPFELERLMDYLLRGVRIFAVSLIVTVLVVPVAFVVILVGNVTVAILLARHEAAGSVLAAIVIAAVVILFLLLMLLAMALVTPLWIRAALETDMGRIFDLAYVRDFLRRTARETLLAHAFQIVLNVGLMLVGVLACFIGMFPAMGIGMLVQAHLLGQLYLLHRSRGGLPAAGPPAVQ